MRGYARSWTVPTWLLQSEAPGGAGGRSNVSCGVRRCTALCRCMAPRPQITPLPKGGRHGPLCRLGAGPDRKSAQGAHDGKGGWINETAGKETVRRAGRTR